jgi:hypothetical protein
MSTAIQNQQFLTATSGTTTGHYPFGQIPSVPASGIEVTLRVSQFALHLRRIEEANDDEVMAAFLEIEPHYQATNRKLADL